MKITDRAIQIAASIVTVPMLLLGVYSGLAAADLAPAAPWSPIGQHEQRMEQEHADRVDDLNDIVSGTDDDRNV